MFKIRTVLSPVDFSEPSRQAVRYAREFTLRMNSSMFLINVVEPRPMAVDLSLNYIPFEEDLEKAARHDLKSLKNELHAEGLLIDFSVEIGNPSDVILEKARELDVSIIIMGSHGKRGISRLIMGSVAETVVRKADCPVLIVKSGEKALSNEEG